MTGLRWTREQYEAHLQRTVQAVSAGAPIPEQPPFKMPANEAGAFALGRLPEGEMNKTEAAYDVHLWEQRHAGTVLWHKFEGIKLRLANNTFLTVDFAVLPSGGVLEMHEVKGRWMDDARVKIKVAASIYPFRFIAVTARAKKLGGGWSREEFA